MGSIIVIVLSYMLGSLLFSVIVSKMVKGVDIRKHGSGNAGATNTLRVLGLGPAILVFVLDTLKGLAAVLAAPLVAPEVDWLPVAAGLAAIFGHNWPLWFRFRGGKGIATTIGVVIGIAFLPGLIAGVIAIGSIVFSRYVSLGSLIFTTLFPICVVLLDYPLATLIGSLVIMVFAWYRHRTNVVKLWRGQENKLGSKSKANNV